MRASCIEERIFHASLRFWIEQKHGHVEQQRFCWLAIRGAPDIPSQHVLHQCSTHVHVHTYAQTGTTQPAGTAYLLVAPTNSSLTPWASAFLSFLSQNTPSIDCSLAFALALASNVTTFRIVRRHIQHDFVPVCNPETSPKLPALLSLHDY